MNFFSICFDRRILNIVLLAFSLLNIITLCEMRSSVKILSWNVNGLRSYLKHDFGGMKLASLLLSRDVDILCLQETKLQDVHVTHIEEQLRKVLNPDSRYYWYCSTARKGYSGTATIVLNKNIDIIDVKYGNQCEEGNMEGRMITLEAPQFSLINTYVPNSGDKLIRLDFRTKTWDRLFNEYLQSIRLRRPELPIILTGDFNVAHSQLDYYNYADAASKKIAGTTPEEQASFDAQFLSDGFIDTFRAAFPDVRSYSFYSARKGDLGRRAKQGWRLDYVLTDGPYLPVEALPSLPYIEEQVIFKIRNNE